MPTLKEFIADVLKKENLIGDVNKIAKDIQNEAKSRAINGIACICDEEVREMTINIADLMLKNPDAYKEDKPKPKKVEEAIEEETEDVIEEVKKEPKKKVNTEPKAVVKEEPKEEVKEEEPKKIAKGTFGKDMIVINVEQESLF